MAVHLVNPSHLSFGVGVITPRWLFVLAGVRGAPDQATGLDGALRTLLGAPFGKVLLTLVALGFAAFAVYSFARARHARV